MKKLLPVITLCFAGAAEAALVDRGGGMIYDTTLNITWLSDWSYAATSGFDSDGLMDWDTANEWASGLVYGGYTDWRLPTSTLWVGRAQESELGHMFYENAGASYGNSILSGTNTANLALFANMQSYYWTSTEWADAAGNAWFYATSEGTQALNAKFDQISAVAVRTGDVVFVAEPASIGLACVALLGAAATRRRRPLAPTT